MKPLPFCPQPKARPRVLRDQDRVKEDRKAERTCRLAVDARDQHRCFFPTCLRYAGAKHHIVARSLGGRWETWNILSTCDGPTGHHKLFKAGLIQVAGNPDDGPVVVYATELGTREGITIPERPK